jgi:hypothetical protein
MDVTAFKMIRPTRDPDEARSVRLPDIKAPDGVDLSTDPLGRYPADRDPTPLEKLYELLRLVDKALTESDDRLPGTKLRELVDKLTTTLGLGTVSWDAITGEQSDARTPYGIALLGIRKALLDCYTAHPPDFERAMALVRRALVAGLLAQWADHLRDLDADSVFDLLNRRPVVLEGIRPKFLAPRARIKLIREAKVSDLKVVRREWAGYIASEVANIRNLMAGESFSQQDKTTHETETTTQATTETHQTTEQEDQSKLDSELTQEVESQLGVTINGHADASAEFKYPVVTAQVSAGVDAGFSLQRSERQASKIAREAVSRALSRVDSMTRESRTRRELMRNEQGMHYKLSNQNGSNLHGVYRWVDRVDTYQLFNYPDRFLLEFEIPDPAEFYRWRTGRQQDNTAARDKPPAFDISADDIAADKLVDLANKYHASNLPSMPDASVSVVRTVTVELGKESTPSDQSQWNAGSAAKEVDIPIPSDYAATQVSYEGEAFPVFANWAVPISNNSVRPVRGYHSAWATVSIGDKSTLYWNGGKDPNGWLATHGDNTDPAAVGEVQKDGSDYGQGLLPIGSGSSISPDPETVTLSPPAVNVVKVALATVGVLSATLTASVRCELTDEAKSAWQLAVHDALYAAWAQWQKDYETALMSQSFTGTTAADAGSSDRNEQIVREELKREVISWLLDEEGFAGRPGLRPRPGAPDQETDFANINFAQAIADAPTIQFLEQAFEWTNLTYMFFPYYWAARSEWEERSQITANDPDFERFLRAGSARVIVPARPGFEVAVHNWLLHVVPFISGKLPSPDDSLYVSIDTEIRELTSPWEGGIPGDTWQARTSTTLLYLESRGDLPFINDHHELPAPPGVPYTPKPVIVMN